MKDPYQANENDGFVTVDIGILSGRLEAEVSVELFFGDQLALSKLRNLTLKCSIAIVIIRRWK